ncbi:MAG: aldo/keto reductase [Streptosporangiaceae bacterium]|nr:aldo/keto reductase [Streptosporangiaceae bacterium]
MDDSEFYAQLGRTGLKISKVALGTVNFGGRVEEIEAHKLLDHAVDAGINLVDTADIYGWRVHQGFTEELLGRWIAGSPARRDKIVLATKVGNRFGSEINDEGLSARHIVRACEQSLRRLGTDWIDLYQMHRVDRSVAWEAAWEAMEMLVAQGKVRYVGSSNHAGWHIAACQESAIRGHRFGLASEQCLYNLLVRNAELEVIPAAQAYGIAILVWSPLHGGLLGGALRKLAEGRAVKSAQGRAAEALAVHRARIAGYERFCSEIGRDPAEVGMAWVLSKPGVTAIVAGPRTPEQLDGAIRAASAGLSCAERTRLDEMFPALGEAPEAWLS